MQIGTSDFGRGPWPPCPPPVYGPGIHQTTKLKSPTVTAGPLVHDRFPVFTLGLGPTQTLQFPLALANVRCQVASLAGNCDPGKSSAGQMGGGTMERSERCIEHSVGKAGIRPCTQFCRKPSRIRTPPFFSPNSRLVFECLGLG